MGLYNFNPGADKWIWDSWGQDARSDWTQHPSRTGIWGISGSSEMQPDGEVAAYSSTFNEPYWNSYQEAVAANPRPAGPTASENAYAASLAAMGIDPSELPYGQVGQESTARVMQQHGLTIPDYLKAWLPKAAGGGQGAQPGLGQYGFDFSQMERLGPQQEGTWFPGGPEGGNPRPIPGGDPMTNNAAAASQQRSADQQAAMIKKFMQMISGKGGAAKSPVSPALIRAAMGGRQVAV